jgi:hypothetical protein
MAGTLAAGNSQPGIAKNVMNLPLRKGIERFENPAALWFAHQRRTDLARHYPLLSNREAWAEATDLMMRFGDHAQTEAAIRADRSRLSGNLIHFCHWRSTERAIEVLRNKHATGTIH